MKTLDKMKKRSSSLGLKNFDNENISIALNTEKQQKHTEIEREIKNIILCNKNNPNELLNFAKNHGCKIYKLNSANKLLNLFKEEQGFLAPFSGAKAFLFNLLLCFVCEQKFSLVFKTKPMFVFEEEINKHLLYHQFYKWYCFNSGLSGFDEKAQRLFKESLNFKKARPIEKLKIDEIVSLKEAIARDKEAADFVILLAKEIDGAKNALNKIISDGGAQL